MSFPWLDKNLKGSAVGAGNRLAQDTRDLRERAAMLARLGFTAAATTARLQARIAWEYEHGRPAALSDAAVAQLVIDTYARHAPR